jgi:hypothetical protein
MENKSWIRFLFKQFCYICITKYLNHSMGWGSDRMSLVNLAKFMAIKSQNNISFVYISY